MPVETVMNAKALICTFFNIQAAYKPRTTKELYYDQLSALMNSKGLRVTHSLSITIIGPESPAVP